MVTKRREVNKFFPLLSCCLIQDPGSGIRDPGIRNGKNSGSGIFDKHPRSKTLLFTYSTVRYLCEAQLVGIPPQKDHNMIQNSLRRLREKACLVPAPGSGSVPTLARYNAQYAESCQGGIAESISTE